MKDEELLQDALGQIGDDLILEGNETPKRKTNWLPKLVSAAACFALLLGLWQLMPRAEQPGVPTWPDTQSLGCRCCRPRRFCFPGAIR